MVRRDEAAGAAGAAMGGGMGDRLCVCGERGCSGECAEGLSAQLEKVDREADGRLMDSMDWAAAYSREAEARRTAEVALAGERARSASLEQQLEQMRRMWLDAEGRAAFGRAA